MSRTITTVGLAVAIAIAGGCRDDLTGPKVLFTLEPLSPTSFAGTVGAAAQHEPIVMLLDRHRKPIVGVPVVFTFHEPQGESNIAVRSVEVLTDAEGVARAGEWTLGAIAGMNLAQATTYGAPQLWFMAKAAPDTPVALRWVQPDVFEIALAGMTIDPPDVLVADRFGNNVPGIPVSFAVLAGGGAIEGAEVISQDNGASAIGWRLGSAGANTIRASALDLASIEFTVEVVAASAIYDLTMIDGAPVDQDHISAFIALTSDGRFFSQIFREDDYHGHYVETETGTYTLVGGRLVLVYTRYQTEEVGRLDNGVLVLDRWEQDAGGRQEWSYVVRADS
ncbi:MAG TPA: hypothetical protein VJ717_06275 [Gemmatimonadaceae bacterium]|nr:hypothetical protein [Gemmatimonadaceae bacterium]